MFRPLVVLLIAACIPLTAAEHAFSLAVAPESEQRIELGREELAEAGALRVRYQRDRDPPERGRVSAYLDLSLVASDGRYFTLADPIELDDRDGDKRVPLDAAHWGGDDGALGADALGAVARLVVRIHTANDEGAIAGSVEIEDAGAESKPFVVELERSGLVDRGPWRELRLRLIGRRDGERGELDLVDGAKRLPFFLDQPVVVDGARWHARGAPRWTLRLRADEQPRGRLEWRSGERTWTSAALPDLAVVAQEPLPEAPRMALPAPMSPAWSGRASEARPDGHWLTERVKMPECPAPILAWNDRWGGFRGGARVAWPEAAALDRLFGGGVAELDLLPQSLLEEHGTFRFGLSPWHAAQGGPWQSPRDAFASDGPWREWRDHARAVLARARAAPGLARWRLGMRELATSDDEVARLHHLLDDLAALVARCDGRPLAILHPQAVDYAFDDHKVAGLQGDCWYGFEEAAGAEAWKPGPPPIAGALTRDTAHASEGKCSLAIPIATPSGSPNEAMGGAFIAPDNSLFNLDLLEFDACVEGEGEVQLYIWATDEHHRWYQQRLACVPADGRWRTVAVPCDDDAPWEATAQDAHWGPEVRRRVRRIGIVGFLHPPAGKAPAAATLRIDRVRRFGWPREDKPQLAFSSFSAGPDGIHLYDAIAADFLLNLPAKNPYDPDSADVVGELEGPGGIKRTYPAYWFEPVNLLFENGAERAAASGPGLWQFRFAPTAPGTWRWRIHAKVKWRDGWTEVASDWREAHVGDAAADAMPPVRVSTRDPMWFETADGAFYFPIGINLRSPGDSRQDHELSQLPRPKPGDVNDFERPLGRSLDFERLGVKAYERWFKRMHDHGLDWARVWMCPWWCGLEWTRAWDGFGGLTVYSQASAARMDRIMDLARQNRIYIQIELNNHGMAGEPGLPDSEWSDSPYNFRNGGPCRRAWEYQASDEAFALQAKRLRYTIARWGWRSQLAAWVTSSEMEYTNGWADEAGRDEGHSRTTEKWVKNYIKWFQDNDPWGRPISAHFSKPNAGPQIWRIPGLTFSNGNAYSAFQDLGLLGGVARWQGGSGGRDLPLALDFYLQRHFPPWDFQRPTIISEWGGRWESNDDGTLRQELRVGLWLQAATPYAGDTGFWWWLWLDAADKWDEYQRVAAFVRGDDRRGLGYRVAKPRVVGGQSHASISGMASATEHRYYAWLTRLDQEPGMHSNRDAGTARIDTGQPGTHWRVERWSCGEGKVEKTFEIDADQAGFVVLPLEVLNPDAAFKLSRVAK